MRRIGRNLPAGVGSQFDSLSDPEDIPNDSAAALVLIEHHWAVPLRDRAGEGFSAQRWVGLSARWIWSGSGCWRPRRPSGCMLWRRLLPDPRSDDYDHDDEDWRYEMMRGRRVARRTSRRVARRR